MRNCKSYTPSPQREPQSIAADPPQVVFPPKHEALHHAMQICVHLYALWKLAEIPRRLCVALRWVTAKSRLAIEHVKRRWAVNSSPPKKPDTRPGDDQPRTLDIR